MTLSLHFASEWRLNHLLLSDRRCYPTTDMAWNSSLGAELLSDTNAFCPKHSLYRGKGELVTNIVPWLYKVERSLSVLWCKCDKGRKEAWTRKKVPTLSRHCCKTLTSTKGLPSQVYLWLPDLDLSVQSAQEFPWKISERKHWVLTRKERSLAFLVCSRKLKILHLRGSSLWSVSPARGTSWRIFKLFLQCSIKRKVRSQL